MAASSLDPVTGAPRFLDTAPPDIKLDPQLAADYAADVGNYIVRADLAALVSYAYKREGLQGYAKDTDRRYVHDGTDWRLAVDGDYKLQRINFTTASSVVFTGFSALFENYRAVLEINASSTTSGGTMRLRSGSTDNSATQYTAQQFVANNGSVTAPRNANLSAFPMLPLNGVEHSIKIDFTRPFVAAVTRVDVSAQSVLDPATNWGSQMWGRHNVASSFDGFTYFPSAGTITGSLTVYGRA
jgi:hypothetical protein